MPLGCAYGLGAGKCCAALNNFVALHYPARHMSWLHCMWGLGASIGPVVMGWAVTGGLKWNGGYLTISIMQVALTAVLIFSLPLWRKMQKSHTGKTENGSETSEKIPGRHYTLPQLVRLRGVKEVLICFFCYCALESTAGIWQPATAPYIMESAERAARWASLFYMGITAGRFVCGFITMKVNDRNMIRLGQVVTAVGIVCILLPVGGTVLFAGLILVAVGVRPFILPSS